MMFTLRYPRICDFFAFMKEITITIPIEAEGRGTTNSPLDDRYSKGTPTTINLLFVFPNNYLVRALDPILRRISGRRAWRTPPQTNEYLSSRGELVAPRPSASIGIVMVAMFLSQMQNRCTDSLRPQCKHHEVAKQIISRAINELFSDFSKLCPTN